MRAEFSEFSFGYAVTEELINWRSVGLVAVPYFPNLREEARLGYDLRLDRPGAPLFLQFKLADGMERRSAVEIKRHRLPLIPTFYRMFLMRSDKSEQHRRLMDLESAGSEVYYVAPRFHTTREFTENYFRRTVVSNSAFIRPGSIGRLPDRKQHHVAYNKAGSQAWRCSEPEELDVPLDGEKLASRIYDTLPNQKPLKHQLRQLLARILSVLEERNIRPPFPQEVSRTRGFDDERRLQRISFLARQYFDCQFIVVQPEKE